MKIDWSEPGVPISILAHAGLLVASLVVLSSPRPLASAQETIPVDVVTANQFAAMVKGEKTAKEVKPKRQRRVEKVAEKEDPKPTHGIDPTDVPTPPARAPEIARTPPAPPLPPTRPPQPVKAEPKPEPTKAAEEPKPEPPKEAEIPRPPERPHPPKHVKPEPPKVAVAKPKKEKLRLDRIAQLLAKTKEEPRKPTHPRAREKGDPNFSPDAIEKLLVSHEKPKESGSSGRKLQREASLGTRDGHAPKLSLDMTQALIGLLQDQFQRCFSAPPGIDASTGAVPMIHIDFASPDGALAGRPVLQNPSSDPGTLALSQAAVRAIARCAPYRIPAQFAPYFNDWRSTTFQIDLKNFVG